MVAQEIEALTMAGATTIVAAMSTDAWAVARDWVVKFFRRHSPDGQDELEARLEANAALVARAGDAERARGVLVGPWQLELEDFLVQHPEAAADLAAVTGQIQAALPGLSQQWVQNITARDHSVVNAVQHGAQHTYYMDSHDARPAAGQEDQESAQ